MTLTICDFCDESECPDICECIGDDDEHERWECDHEDYDVDIPIGRATCAFCGHTWYLSKEELEEELTL